jgi:HAD superfamily hydrolase (TIGR01549 family)
LSMSSLASAVASPECKLVSTDVFDTVLLRDHTIESSRLAISSRQSARALGLDPRVLTRLRWRLRVDSYRAVTLTRAEGEASLSAICLTLATALGLDEGAAQLMRRTEVDVDAQHLHPNRPLLAVLEQARRYRRRVVAVSDTYYDGHDLRHMLTRVVGADPFDAVYTSSDLGLTKQAGAAYAEVARREGVPPQSIVHVGDSEAVDVVQARAAGWVAVHMPRGRRYRVVKVVGKALALPTKLQAVT